MRYRARLPGVLGIAAAVTLAACGGGTSSAGSTTRTPAAGGARSARLHWTPLVQVQRVLDLAGPRGDGSVIVVGDGRLFRLAPGRAPTPYADRYRSPGGEEPYIAIPPRTGSCFHRGDVYALRLRPPRGVVAISGTGRVAQLAVVHAPGLIDGITFDATGRFAHRMLVTVNDGAHSTVEAIGCHGSVFTITSHAPRIEGGIQVAPATFGRFGGDLIAPDERAGLVFAITPTGRSILVARSGLPHGPDIGVESEGFVPASGPVDALVADRLTPGNRHPGDDRVLRIGASALRSARIRAGELLVVTEGGALTDAIRCGRVSCQVRRLADGPAIAHIEGHVVFAPG